MNRGAPTLSRAEAVLQAGDELLQEHGDSPAVREAIRESVEAAEEVDAKSLAHRERSRSERSDHWREAMPELAEAMLTPPEDKSDEPYWRQSVAGAGLAEAMTTPSPNERWKAHQVATMAAELNLRDDRVDVPALAREGAAAAAYLGPMNIRSDGALHRDLGVPEGEPLPQDRITGLAKQPGESGSRARLALALLDQARRSARR